MNLRELVPLLLLASAAFATTSPAQELPFGSPPTAPQKEVLCDGITMIEAWRDSLPPGNKNGTKAEKNQYALKQEAKKRAEVAKQMKPKVHIAATKPQGALAITTPEQIKMIDTPNGLDSYAGRTGKVCEGGEVTLIDPEIAEPMSMELKPEERQILAGLVMGHEAARQKQVTCAYSQTDQAIKTKKPHLKADYSTFDDFQLKDLKQRYQAEKIAYTADVSYMDWAITQWLKPMIDNATGAEKDRLKQIEMRMKKKRKYHELRRALSNQNLLVICNQLNK